MLIRKTCAATHHVRLKYYQKNVKFAERGDVLLWFFFYEITIFKFSKHIAEVSIQTIFRIVENFDTQFSLQLNHIILFDAPLRPLFFNRSLNIRNIWINSGARICGTNNGPVQVTVSTDIKSGEDRWRNTPSVSNQALTSSCKSLIQLNKDNFRCMEGIEEHSSRYRISTQKM